VPLDPQVLAMRERSEKAGTPPLYTLTLAQAREADLAAIQAASGGDEPVHEVVDRTVPGPDGTDLPVRIYRPSGERDLPVLVYFFGGGWTLGSIETSDAVCRTLANATGALVLAPGYRLAPEHKFPAAVHDCHAAVCWVAANGTEIGADPTRIAVGGDSAGGNLAAAVTLLAREGGPRLAAQLLVYPNTDYLSDTPSLRENTDPYLFNRTSVGWYWGHYLADPADGSDPLASPLRADDLSGLPPALVITAEFDPLRDQAEEYAAALSKAGVPAVSRRYDGMVHGFFCMSGELAAGRRALAEAAAFLRDRLA
jgi:acetyl esterase